MKFCSMILAYNEEEMIRGCLYGLKDIDNFVVISKPWFGKHKKFDKTERIARSMNASIIRKDFREERDERNYVMEIAQEKGYDYVFIIDADEYYLREDIHNMISFIEENNTIKRFNIGTCIYLWKNENWEIRPRFNNIIPICYNSDLRFHGLRNIVVQRTETKLIPEEIIMYHFSYAGSSERMKMKLEHFSHANEMSLDWVENVYEKWIPKMENLHPSRSASHVFKKAIPYQCPKNIISRFKNEVTIC